MILNTHNKLRILSIIIITTLFITACGSSNEVTYRVTGKGVSTASVVYNNANENELEEQVDLPWEKTIGIDEGFDAKLIVTNLKSTGEVTCSIWLNENELGQASSAINSQCFVLKIRTGEDEMNPFLGRTIEKTLEHTQKLVEQGNFEKALEYANSAVEAAPNYSSSYVSRAVVYAELGELESAKADLLKVQELSDDPDLLEWVEDKLSEY